MDLLRRGLAGNFSLQIKSMKLIRSFSILANFLTVFVSDESLYRGTLSDSVHISPLLKPPLLQDLELCNASTILKLAFTSTSFHHGPGNLLLR